MNLCNYNINNDNNKINFIIYHFILIHKDKKNENK